MGRGRGRGTLPTSGSGVGARVFLCRWDVGPGASTVTLRGAKKGRSRGLLPALRRPLPPWRGLLGALQGGVAGTGLGPSLDVESWQQEAQPSPRVRRGSPLQ